MRHPPHGDVRVRQVARQRRGEALILQPARAAWPPRAARPPGPVRPGPAAPAARRAPRAALRVQQRADGRAAQARCPGCSSSAGSSRSARSGDSARQRPHGLIPRTPRPGLAPVAPAWAPSRAPPASAPASTPRSTTRSFEWRSSAGRCGRRGTSACAIRSTARSTRSGRSAPQRLHSSRCVSSPTSHLFLDGGAHLLLAAPPRTRA